MGLFSKKISKEKREVVINDMPYNVNIVYEFRKNSRVSITKSGINIRVINFISNKEKELQIEKFLIWAKKTIKEKNISFTKPQKKFKNGDILKLYDKTVRLEINEVHGSRVNGAINSESIIINLPKIEDSKTQNEYVSKMIARLLAKNYKAKITKKLHDFNHLHKFGELNNVRLKNNATNWGSCSSKNNINISVRLFLSPEWVVDYVLIHELSHLKHRNHSSNFWNEVAKAYPNYKEAENWLKTNSRECII